MKMRNFSVLGFEVNLMKNPNKVLYLARIFPK
jgi:hypothetical protein